MNKREAPNRREAPLSNINSEKALLGALIRSPHAYWQVASSLRADHFTIAFHRELFTVIADVSLAGTTLSMPVMLSRLRSETDAGESATAYLAALVHNADGLSPSDFADDVAQTAGRRQAIALAERLIKAARQGERPAIEILADAEAELLEVMQVSTPQRPKKLSELNAKVLHAASTARDRDIMPGLTTGLIPIDEILGLMLGGDSGYIIASQSDGKSALAAQIGCHVAESRPVIMFQFEMGEEQIAARELAAASGVSVREINEGAFNAWQWDDLQAAERKLSEKQFYVLDTDEMTVRQMASQCVAMKRTIGLGLVIVDQLDKVKTVGRHKDRFEAHAERTAGIKRMAKMLSVPVITLAQRTRGAQRRDDPTPDTLDADAPSIERDADWVIGLWRRHTWLQRNKPHPNAKDEERSKFFMELNNCKDLAEAIILKHRRRQSFEQRKMHWNGALTRFSVLGDQ